MPNDPKVAAFNTAMNAFLDKQGTDIDNIVADQKVLTDLIAQLQSTQGQITDEDQGLLDQIQARASAITDKLDALDAANPPPAP